MDKVQIDIIFRPISQPAGMPARRPQGETRHTPRPWQQGTGSGPAAREAKPPSLTRPPGPSREQAKPEVRPASSPAQAPPAPATEPRQAPNVAGPPAPVEPPSSSAQSTSPTAPGTKATPEPGSES
jgi:hypothetical protein